MRSTIASLFASAVALVSVSGCVFYADDDDPCLYGGDTPSGGTGDGAPEYQPGQRNPETGECEFYGGDGGGDIVGDGGCDERCGPCPYPAGEAGEAAEDRAPLPTWGYCESQCTGLDEAGCLAENGCRAIYQDACADGDADCEPALVYAECWSTDMTGPIQGGGCDTLDAFTCSQHDDCIAVHYLSCSGDDPGGADLACVIGSFSTCGDEPTEDPGPGTCDGELICERAAPACPEGTVPGIANGCYTDYCIPLAECDNEPDPGMCYSPVTCDAPSPACPEGTTPGIENGCYTGWCIPMDDCEPGVECSDISVEATCIAREDCTPFYQGIDCDCTGDVCDCADWVFQSCS